MKVKNTRYKRRFVPKFDTMGIIWGSQCVILEVRNVLLILKGISFWFLSLAGRKITLMRFS